MITFWGLILGVPLLAFGGVVAYSPALASRWTKWFRESKAMAWILCAVAWFWTAYECDIIGIEIFDRFTKMFPGELWILAALLTPLTVAWMPANLPVRALTGILMLLPAELFKTTHAFRPAAGIWFAPVDIFVYTAYVGVIIGMYGMFYPWRLERGMDLALSRDIPARIFGSVLAVLGSSLVIIGFTL